MLRSVAVVVCGFAAMTALSLVADAALMSVKPDLFSTGGVARSVPLLVFILIYSFVFLAVGGYLTAAIAKRSEINHVLALGALLLVMSVVASAQLWETAPAWWHIVSLASIVPGVLFGGFICAAQHQRARPPLYRTAL